VTLIKRVVVDVSKQRQLEQELKKENPDYDLIKRLEKEVEQVIEEDVTLPATTTHKAKVLNLEKLLKLLKSKNLISDETEIIDIIEA